MRTTLITDELVREVNRNMWDEARTQYGEDWQVPRDVRTHINEFCRALYVLQKWQNEGGTGNPTKTLTSHSVYPEVIVEVMRDYCSMDIDSVDDVVIRTEKRADKYGAFVDWTKEHLFEQYTTEQLVSISGFSYPTTLKFLQESPVFRKIKKGLWEIRDPKADREAERIREESAGD